MKYAVTGSTGALGTLVIDHLLQLDVPASSIVAVARDTAKASSLTARDVEVRIADYDDREALAQALSGVDRLLLISGLDAHRVEQHRNVIDIAKEAGVKRLLYTSINHAETSSSPMAPDHKATEAIIAESGIPAVILRNNWYTENYIDPVQRAKQTGTIEAAVGDGRVASSLRTEYAEAAARTLVEDGHEGHVYELTGPVWDYSQLAAAAEKVLGTQVTFVPVSAEARAQSLRDAGAPDAIVGFVVAIDKSIADGALDVESSDLEKLLGRKPKGLREALEEIKS